MAACSVQHIRIIQAKRAVLVQKKSLFSLEKRRLFKGRA